MNTFKVNFISLFEHTEQITIQCYSHQVKENKLCGLASKDIWIPHFLGSKLAKSPLKECYFQKIIVYMLFTMFH